VNVGRLVIPALRWRAETGFGHESAAIEAALAAGVGGFIVFGGPAGEVAALVGRLRERAARPLLIGADLERGAGQQFAGLRELPPPAALASLGDLSIVREAGRITGADARSVGVDWVYAPVADLDLEPANPIVQTRSFGADPARVALAVAAWIDGARAAGAKSCVKHFPGHGRTVRDSHDQLPVVAAGRAELAAADLVPFRAAIAAGVDAVMTCHVAFPALDPAGLPATLSAPILHLLRSELGFGGLIVSDALIMDALRGERTVEAASVAAVRAGVDCLLYPPDPVAMVEALTAAIRDDPVLRGRVAASLERINGAAARAAGTGPPAADAGDTAELADQIVAGSAPRLTLRRPIELVIVDDDLEGAYPASSSDHTRAALADAGVSLGEGGSVVGLAFAEPRASKGRAGFGPRCAAQLAGLADRADLIVLFAHPRLAAELPAGPVLLAWHRQRLMQAAVARWIAGRSG
jgi:beta-glucosidase